VLSAPDIHRVHDMSGDDDLDTVLSNSTPQELAESMIHLPSKPLFPTGS
jgi:hypothetical protein